MANIMIIYFKFILTSILLLSAKSCEEALYIKYVDRTIDISTQLSKISYVIHFHNSGNTTCKKFSFMFDSDILRNLSYFQVQDQTGTLLYQFQEFSSLIIEFSKNLLPDDSIKIEIEAVFTHQLVPLPVSITQSENQLVQYRGNLFLLTPYTVMKQTTTINIGKTRMENFTKHEPFALSGGVLSYGPYDDITPFSSAGINVHYENNSPFLTITNLVRVIELSHWGNIAVEETIDILHTGAALRGPFSRVELQNGAQRDSPCVKSFTTVLPASATDVYYRDTIGNISTSHVKVLKDYVELELRPRFPLFGRWKTQYTVGYNVPSYEYLFNNGDEYVLQMRILDHVFDNMVVDRLTTKIILPEGCANVVVNTPFPMERLPDSRHFSYLDTKGRTVITLQKINLVEQHIQDFQVRYNFKSVFMFQEPLLIVTGIYSLFLAVIIFVRVDFSISKAEVEEINP